MIIPSNPLVVPMNVQALAVNERDARDASPFLSGASAMFDRQAGVDNDAFLGANVNRSLMAGAAQPLEPGVHLHWALPKALCNGLARDSELQFPAAPNRWLVNRIVVSGRSATRTSWVVLSDLLNDDMPTGQMSITLPTVPSESGQNFQYCGEHQPFDGQWQEPVIPSGQTFAAMTGSNLTAVANGHPTFATFYPNCRGVFGFTDTLADLEVPRGQSIDLMYTVTGWYSDMALDPLGGGKLALADIQETLGWTFDLPDSRPGGKEPDCSLFHGNVQGVSWHPDRTYLPDYTAATPVAQMDLSLGCNPPEAMSSYLLGKIESPPEYCELLLDAYFEGLLTKLNEPQSNQLNRLREELHELGFRSDKAEYLYSITEQVGTDSIQVEAEDLPPAIGDALNALNMSERRLALLIESMAKYQWQLFSDWYRIFMVDDVTLQQGSYDVANNKLKELPRLHRTIELAARAVQIERGALIEQLLDNQQLQQLPAPRFWQPTDLSCLLSGDADALPSINRYDNGEQPAAPGGYLRCRLNDQLVTRATVNGLPVGAANFANCALPESNNLPVSDTFNSLLIESLILNVDLLSSLGGGKVSFQDLLQGLLGRSKSIAVKGRAPAFCSLNDWTSNPWVPLLAYWEVEFAPVFPLTDAVHDNYSANFFNSQFTIGQNEGAAIGYVPPGDPANSAFCQSYTGVAYLSTSAIDNFTKDLAESNDPFLQECLRLIRQKNMVVQALSGFNEALVMHDQQLQLDIAVPSGAAYEFFTQAVAAAVGVHSHTGPNFNSFFNPVRAGYLKVGVTLIDVFGQKRRVEPITMSIAESLTATYHERAVPNIAFLPPRMSEEARLLFRFIAADSSGVQEMNAHPATSPICGWLMPNLLARSLFVYNAHGGSVGSLFLNDAGTELMWQSAPGNDETIDLDAEATMQDQQPQLRDLIMALRNGSPQFFKDFIQSIDNVSAYVQPQSVMSDSPVPLIIGRPLAIVQAALALELMGTAHCNQSMGVLDLPPSNTLCETDNGLTQIDYPVVLGNFEDLEDGLFGFFKFEGGDYRYGNFYTMGADSAWESGVQLPSQSTITVKPRPEFGAVTLEDAAFQKVLMLLDPHATVAATTGILPTKRVVIPPNMFSDSIRKMEVTFETAPILGGSSALTIPLIAEAGYGWSWVQERKAQPRSYWDTKSEISAHPPEALWTYSPQTLLEGWLRLAPDLLRFSLVNTDKKALVMQGVNNGMSITFVNELRQAITLVPGRAVEVGTQAVGSIFYLHFGQAVRDADVPRIQLRGDGWSFTPYQSERYGGYIAAVRTEPLTLGGGVESVPISVDNLTITTDKQLFRAYFDCYGIPGVDFVSYVDKLAVAAPSQT